MTFSLSYVIGIVFLLLAVIMFTVYIIKKIQTVSILRANVENLKNTVAEMEHQAKLIIKSDMELKLYQDEVEDKNNKLIFLKNLILSSLNILDKEDLYAQFNEKTLNDLGFKKGLILNYSDLETKLSLNIEPPEAAAIHDFLLHKKPALDTHQLIAPPSEICAKLIYSLGFDDFLIAPIKGREKVHAVFFIARLVVPIGIRSSEREIFSIICMYLGQCLDNIDLFEDLYMIKDDLEKKMRERTNELVKSLKEIERISKTKSDFISSVSHELRTPLTSVKGFSSLLIEEKFGKLPQEAKQRLEKIDVNVNKLVDMVNILLDISRIESGKTEVKIAPSDIVKLLKDTGDFLSPQMQAKNITLNYSVPEKLNVYMDKNLIERVFINLINNAIKFTPDGGAITLNCTREDKQAIIAISDTGCGIPKDDLEKVFKEFYRTSVTKSIQGSGLGLSLVKRIIDTHKQKIWLESELDKGTTFYFTLDIEEK